MYRHEWLPQCIAIGITPEQFWRMNPRLLEPYYEAERLKEQQRDNHMWIMGAYVFEAVQIAIGNAFRGKGKKPRPYREKPFSVDVREERGELTEEEKYAKTQMLFKALQVMKVNYDLDKKFNEPSQQDVV